MTQDAETRDGTIDRLTGRIGGRYELRGLPGDGSEEYPAPVITVAPVTGSTITPSTPLAVSVEFFRPVTGVVLVGLFNNEYGDAPGEAIYMHGYGFFGGYQESSAEEVVDASTVWEFVLVRDGGWPVSDTLAQFKVAAFDSAGGDA